MRDLAGESLKTAWEIVTGQNPDAAIEGTKIAAMFGGGLRMTDLAGQNIIFRTACYPENGADMITKV